MTEWWTYRPEDFLLFSPRVYWRMFEVHNATWWPLHIITLGAAFCIIILLIRRRPQRYGQWIAVILAVVWAFVGWYFLWDRYAQINWAAAYVAPAFLVQALLLAACTLWGTLTFDRPEATGQSGLLLAVAGLVAYPLLPPLFGRPWASAEVFGIAPDPTGIVTLGILFLATGRFVPLLFPIPLLWLLASGLTLHTMGDRQAWVPFSAVGFAVALLVLRRLGR